jgi:hypothetical protein
VHTFFSAAARLSLSGSNIIRRFRVAIRSHNGCLPPQARIADSEHLGQLRRLLVEVDRLSHALESQSGNEELHGHYTQMSTFRGAKGRFRSSREKRISPSSLRTSKAPFRGCHPRHHQATKHRSRWLGLDATLSGLMVQVSPGFNSFNAFSSFWANTGSSQKPRSRENNRS